MTLWRPTRPSSRNLVCDLLLCLALGFGLAGCEEGPSGSLSSGGSKVVADWDTTMPPQHAAVSVSLPEGLSGVTVSAYVHLETSVLHPSPTSADGYAECQTALFHGATKLSEEHVSSGVSPHLEGQEPWGRGATVNMTLPGDGALKVVLGKDYARDLRATLDCRYDITSRGPTHMVITLGPLVVNWGA